MPFFISNFDCRATKKLRCILITLFYIYIYYYYYYYYY